jgi:hypothetical protein
MRTFLVQISDEDFANADAETQADILRSEIVRCRDCKWQGRHWENGTVSCGSDLGMISAPDDGYCSFGERKEATT